MKYQKRLAEIAGWCGAAAIMAAYALVSFGVVAANDWIFHALNLVGALGVMYISIRKKAGQPALLNAFWALIALAALMRLAL